VYYCAFGLYLNSHVYCHLGVFIRLRSLYEQLDNLLDICCYQRYSSILSYILLCPLLSVV
jgi:hypothetical protein